MSGHRPFSELSRDFSADRLLGINAESERLNAEILAANPKLADPEYVKARAEKIFGAWDRGDWVQAEILINGG